MERLTARNERFPDETYYPYCFREDTCRGEGMSDKCDMCEQDMQKACRLRRYRPHTGADPEAEGSGYSESAGRDSGRIRGHKTDLSEL